MIANRSMRTGGSFLPGCAGWFQMRAMSARCFTGFLLGLALTVCGAAEFQPASQHFRQEIAVRYSLPKAVQLVDCAPDGKVRAFTGGEWLLLEGDQWRPDAALRAPLADVFIFAAAPGQVATAPVSRGAVKQLLRTRDGAWVLTARDCWQVPNAGAARSHVLPGGITAQQLAVSPAGVLHVATTGGLLVFTNGGWQALQIFDEGGRTWAARNVLGVGFDSRGQLWFATKAGVGCQTEHGWKFYEGKDGLPWADFTGVTTGPGDAVWFTTHLGVIRFEKGEWHYRQGHGWLPSDEVSSGVVDPQGDAWFATAVGVGKLARQDMTLAAKADRYEQEIERYIKRTPYGYVDGAPLRKAEDKSTAEPNDSDNDGLWTSMYGAGECFAYGATKDATAKQRARQAFEALRFLQKVTQGGAHAPDKGFVARTIRPIDWPDPNVGRLEDDRRKREQDKLWKVYEPRWPRSADGKWYWKSDTSSDELDGHYFFYPLYYDLCADTPEEKERVREVVRDLTDHIIAHGYQLVDHDGQPTRWAVYGPQLFNKDPRWWQERGLNALSMLSYLAVAAHVTGDEKYRQASRDLIDNHGYAHNLMFAKVQQGAGSGNQSDDEMAFMSYYGLLRCSTDEALKKMVRFSFFMYWMNESAELNPFFNFAYAGVNANQRAATADTEFSLTPPQGWFEDSMATLYGFPLDRLSWDHHNSHRLDVVKLPMVRSEDLADPDAPGRRGYLVNGKVLPIENRHVGHWNTDPWRLDYHGNGHELSAGTVFLLPYYMGLYHGYIEKPVTK